MKFLVLAMCVCAASAASFEYQPRKYQPVQSFQPVAQGGQAFAQAVASAPETGYRTVGEPIVKAFNTVNNAPAAVAKAAAYTAPEAVAKSAYTAPEAVAKSAAYTAPVGVRNTGIVGKEVDAAILRFESGATANGYDFIYETANGIAAQSSGSLKKIDNTDALVSQGSYRYVAPDGTNVQFSYIADENGYQPKSDLLPVAPAIPEAILRSLEYNRLHPQKVESY